LSDNYFSLTDIENNVRLENDMMGRDVNEINVVRRKMAFK
jgi:hypothetical protein